ncbi:MAG: DNA gyrase subunit A [Candidatus Pacebacteria bacterium]|nr:DNA gyrase subunit A [Candidatus Paceibacterota bacterium]
MSARKRLDTPLEDENRPPTQFGKVIDAPIVETMRKSFLDYAMSVITERALPDSRDGLKPVHRRILYGMFNMGLTPNVKTRKSAAIVGEVLGKYHPHGDASVYEAMVKLAQPFTTRYPLVIGQGNFGSLDGDNAAAPRYTEAKLSKIAIPMLADLDKDTVDFRPNYENTLKEPVVLPTSVPSLLLNGTLGIAVGMACNIPPHNLRELIDASVHLLEDPKATTEDLLNYVKGPDFPTGGMIFNEKDIHLAYANGRGGVVCRGEAEIVEQKNGMFQIVITSIPFRVTKSDLVEKIGMLVHEKKLEGIKGLRDESTEDVRVVVDVKPSAHPQNILNFLYKHTQLEETFHFNMVALVDGIPQTLSLKAALEEYVKHRYEVVTRRTKFELAKAEAREHILIGLKIALDHIDEVIKTIRASKDTPTAKANLIKKFKLSDIQATAILEMRLQKLAGLERQKVEDELAAVRIVIKDLKELLASPTKMKNLIKKEMIEIGEKFGDDRKTKVMKRGVKNVSPEDLIPDEDSVLVLTKGGYIKRTNPNEYKQQKRGGVGVVDLDTKDEDFVKMFLHTTTHADLLFFTDAGKVYQIKMYDIPEGRRATKGKSIMNFISLSPEEEVTSVIPMPKELKNSENLSVMMITREGVAKKVDAKSFHDVRRSGIIAISLAKGDRLVNATFVDKGDEMIIVSSEGQSIRFKESDVRQMGRTAAGVNCLTLKTKDYVVGTDVIHKGGTAKTLLVFSEQGYGKQTDLKEYKVQKRGGSGIKTAKVTDKIGRLISACVITDDLEEIVTISKKSQVVRVDLKEVPKLGRQTQGVKIMKLRAGDAIASTVCF